MTYEERIYTHTNYGMEKLTSLVSVVVDNYYYDKTENVILITFVKLDEYGFTDKKSYSFSFNYQK